MLRYIIGFFIAVGLIVVVIVLIVRGLSSGHKGPTVTDLNSYANTDIKVQLTIDNPVSAPSTHRDIIITVSSSNSTILITQGYQGQIVTMQTYSMDPSSYAVFLHALSLNGFTKGNSDPAASDDRGHCALGDRYIYEVPDGSGTDLQRYWYTSCGTGTFNGNVNTIQHLFELQIPNYNQLTSNIQF